MEFPEVKLRQPESEHIVRVTPDWQVAIDDRVVNIGTQEAIVLNALTNHLDQPITTADLWEEVKVKLDGQDWRPDRGKAIVKSHVVRMQDGLGNCRRLGRVAQHIFRLGSHRTAMTFLVSDIATPEFGLEKIALYPADTFIGRHRSQYQQSFLERYQALSVEGIPEVEVVPVEESQPNRVRAPRRQAVESVSRVQERINHYDERRAAQVQEKHALIQRILSAQEGATFSHDDLTDDSNHEGRNKLHFAALQELLKQGSITVRRDSKGRTIYVRI